MVINALAEKEHIVRRHHAMLNSRQPKPTREPAEHECRRRAEQHVCRHRSSSVTVGGPPAEASRRHSGAYVEAARLIGHAFENRTRFRISPGCVRLVERSYVTIGNYCILKRT